MFHCGPGLAGLGKRLGQRIERAGDVVLVFVGGFGVVVDLHFVAVVDGHPGLARLDGNADEYAGVVVLVTHLEDHADDAVADRAGGPIEQPHAAVGPHESVLDDHFTGADVLPASEVFAVEELDPAVGLCDERKSEDKNECEQRESFHHEASGNKLRDKGELSAAENDAPTEGMLASE